MKKNHVFGFVLGLMLGFFCKIINYSFTDWQWWAIIILLESTIGIIYHKSK